MSPTDDVEPEPIAIAHEIPGGGDSSESLSTAPGWPRAERARSETAMVGSLEKRIVRVETWLILLSVAAIAIADYVIGPSTSLGPLYLIPTSYSALTHKGRTTALLFLFCVSLRQLFGPIQASSDPWGFFFRDLVVAGIFLLTVIYLNRLGTLRRRFFELARRQRDELAREVEMAVEVQGRVLRLNQPPREGLDVYATMDPLKGVGGDYYDFLDLGEGVSGVVIADVAGKGLPAALLMPAVRIALRSIVTQKDEPSEVIAELNRILCENTDIRNYATLWFAQLDAQTGKIDYVNAGHLPGLLLDSDGNARWLESGGPPVGLLPNSDYLSEGAVLEPGGALILYTDGVAEATNDSDQEFGMEGLERVVKKCGARGAREIVAAIRREVDGFLGGRASEDDLTVIAIRRPLASSPP